MQSMNVLYDVVESLEALILVKAQLMVPSSENPVQILSVGWALPLRPCLRCWSSSVLHRWYGIEF